MAVSSVDSLSSFGELAVHISPPTRSPWGHGFLLGLPCRPCPHVPLSRCEPGPRLCAPRRERLVGMWGGEGGGEGEGAGARLFIHSQGCRQEVEIKVGEMSSFGIYVFRVAWTMGPAVF